MFRKITKKQKETLGIMKKNRAIDSQNLRNLIEQKLKWATQERQKGLNLIEETKVKDFKLNGMIILINELLKPKEEGK